ncbi:hypothetical protein BDN72DRAFT_864736 [Pluteus cervinus]|uniref:Uncharacterized protein n=1 Tax=Pluteus cervinus TaxID=181527 RepID=A0ACD3A2M0_9AGAR|nr:hypothetical protein BDN72DRAFT_864736 [Pluteus cervinus]
MTPGSSHSTIMVVLDSMYYCRPRDLQMTKKEELSKLIAHLYYGALVWSTASGLLGALQELDAATWIHNHHWKTGLRRLPPPNLKLKTRTEYSSCCSIPRGYLPTPNIPPPGGLTGLRRCGYSVTRKPQLKEKWTKRAVTSSIHYQETTGTLAVPHNIAAEVAVRQIVVDQFDSTKPLTTDVRYIDNPIGSVWRIRLPTCEPVVDLRCAAEVVTIQGRGGGSVLDLTDIPNREHK